MHFPIDKLCTVIGLPDSFPEVRPFSGFSPVKFPEVHDWQLTKRTFPVSATLLAECFIRFFV
jgi:hypothetical protein